MLFQLPPMSIIWLLNIQHACTTWKPFNVDDTQYIMYNIYRMSQPKSAWPTKNIFNVYNLKMKIQLQLIIIIILAENYIEI